MEQQGNNDPIEVIRPFKLKARPRSAEAMALAEAAKAWNVLNTAESQIRRLNGYQHLTAGMKDDRTRYAQQAGEARATLNRVLRIAA